jgi:DNA-binding CsgD family transcriptional regulator
MNIKPYKLSEREEQILCALSDGCSNKEIARRYAMSYGTVKVHVKAILRKLGLRNRTQAAIWALKGNTMLTSEQRNDLYDRILEKHGLNFISVKVPAAIAVALQTNRPEMVKLAEANDEETKELHNCIVMLMRQNIAIREYTETILAATLEPWGEAADDLIKVTEKFKKLMPTQET